MANICRFAPSPTGFLHVGNIRTAIVNYLYAKKTGAKFILRLDDTDIQRVKEEYRLAIIEDMKWLGLEFDELQFQSKRLDKYEQAKNLLIKSGHLYECFETPEELNMQRRVQTSSGVPPVYDRGSLKLSGEQKNKLKEQGIKPHYRFLLRDGITSWEDKIKGHISYQDRHFSDPVLIRDNGVPTYTFCSVVDDIDMNISDVIRGEDHITNTAIQIQIFEALQAKIPHFSHLALVKASSGKISKREGGFDVAGLRKDGYEPLTIINFLAQIGTSEAINIYSDINNLINNFDFKKFSKSSTSYDINELKNINHKMLQIVDFKELEASLTIHNLTMITKDFFETIKPNLSLITEIKSWQDLFQSNFLYSNSKEDQLFLKEIINLLPEETNNENAWQHWLDNIKNWQLSSNNEHSQRKGKTLFMPIRLALTGLEHGPEMKSLIKIIDRQKIIERLSN